MTDISVDCGALRPTEQRMYLQFFHFERMPFETVPDPRFYFPTPQHDEAGAALNFGVKHARGLTVLVGRAGCGKTLLARKLLGDLDARSRTVLLHHPPETGRDLMESVCRGFAVRFARTQTTGELIERLHSLALAGSPDQVPLTVVLDDAHRMTPETLEWVCALAALETATTRLVQLVLLGQPQLLSALDEPGLEALRQRIFCVRRLVPFDHSDTRRYIEHRLRYAGARAPLFSDDAVERIHSFSGGIPRVINQVADNALITAFATAAPQVDASSVDEVCRNMLNLEVDLPTAVSTANPAPRRHSSQFPVRVTASARQNDVKTGKAPRGDGLVPVVESTPLVPVPDDPPNPIAVVPASTTVKRRRAAEPAPAPTANPSPRKPRTRRKTDPSPVAARLEALADGQQALENAMAEARQWIGLVEDTVRSPSTDDAESPDTPSPRPSPKDSA